MNFLIKFCLNRFIIIFFLFKIIFGTIFCSISEFDLKLSSYALIKLYNPSIIIMELSKDLKTLNKLAFIIKNIIG